MPPTKTLERKLLKKYRHIVAVDEVGMGCLAGPVVVCAVMFAKKFYNHPPRNLSGVRDSKLLSAKQREKLAERLTKERKLKYQLAFCYPKTIDRMNIYRAARTAMKRAVLKLAELAEGHPLLMEPPQRVPLCVLVDGPHKIPNLDYDQLPIIKGDRKVFTIACASIIAKVYRDKMMIRYAKKYPNYGFEKHKGYGTKYHVAQLIAYGPSSIHRKSFASVTKLL